MKILIYIDDTCVYCLEALGFLLNRGCNFEIKNVIKDIVAAEEYKKMQSKGVPLIIIGDQSMLGFSKEVLGQLLYSDKHIS